MRRRLVFFFVLLLAALPAGAQAPFMAASPDKKEATAIALPRDAKTTSAVRYLQDGIRRMTGKTPEIQNDGTGLTQGLVLATLDTAPADLKNDAEIKVALQIDPKAPGTESDAYFIRSEPQRVIVIANTQSGLNAGVAALLESVDYEVLGMGPDWIHVPDYKNKPLLFTIKEAGRPGIGMRVLRDLSLWGALAKEDLSNPEWKDIEPAAVSVERWLVGSRFRNQSAAESFQNLRMAVIWEMIKERSEAGLLVDKVIIRNERPDIKAASIWITETGGVFYPTYNWQNITNQPWAYPEFDLSVPLVRHVILNVMKEQAKKFWTENPGEIFYFRPEPAESQAGFVYFDKHTKNKNWFPEYVAGATNDATNALFAFHGWLLREFDKWIDSLPAEQRNTGGKPKKERVRSLFTSTLYTDTIPTFKPDPRVQVTIAPSAWHRDKFPTWQDRVKPFQALMPGSPLSFSCIVHLPSGSDLPVPAQWANLNMVALLGRIKEVRDAGIQGLTMKTDLNFGKNGLYYYLLSKILWNPNMSVEQINALRDRWFQRAFGSGHEEMKAYYDYQTPRNFETPTGLQKSKVVRWLDEAGKKVANEPAARQRVDNTKQFLYFQYILATRNHWNSDETCEFVWKGQTAYTYAMASLGRQGTRWQIAQEIWSTPPRYTKEETEAWWAKVKAFWPPVVLPDFEESIIADGTRGADVDLNDLVTIGQFGAVGVGGHAQGYSPGTTPFILEAKSAGDIIGVTTYWNYIPADGRYIHDNVYYGVSRWDKETRQWREVADMATTFQPSEAFDPKAGANIGAIIRFTAPQAGAYRFNLPPRPGGGYTAITALDAIIGGHRTSGRHGNTFSNQIYYPTQASPSWFYIPKGTWQLAVETVATPEPGNNLVIQLYRGVPAWGMTHTRTISIKERGYHTIKLNPGEDGSVACIWGRGSVWLLSIPHLISPSITTLLIPKAIAKADGLTILSDDKPKPAAANEKP